jgi:hypothetical protein
LVSYWLKKSKKGVAAGFVLAIEAATGTPRERLRPDLYLPTPRRGQTGKSVGALGDLKSTGGR